MEKKGYLLLEDGTLYTGVLRGAQKDAAAELVFLTSVVGYMDTLTDPAYEGQIVVQTFPAIGNYGVVPLDTPAKPKLAGYVVRELCDAPSNFRCQGKLDDYLRDNGINCLTVVDTRDISRRLRDNVVMKP
ncbi:MAG: carbamoyl phosphate synthase small subunit, partial [Clostridia bacterium]|nr:carbamoyl phosphate synthase small subunit [Clostridia bacterium]